MKKLISFVAAAALMASLLPNAFASEITDTGDPNYNGYTWKEIEVDGELGIYDNHATEASITINDKAEYVKLGNSSAKIKRTGGNDNGINITLSNTGILQRTGEAVKAISIDVYVPELDDDGNANDAIDSTISGYVKTSAPDSYLNGAEGWIEARALKSGWNTVVFDAVNGTSMPFFVWRETSTNHDGAVIYVDNIRVYYQTPSSVYDSFENYTDDWKPETNNGYTLSQNTDPTYVKDGRGSLKIDCPSEHVTDANFIISKLDQLENYYGRQIPLIDGYTAKTIGLWVYSDGVRGSMKPRSASCTAAEITKDGWQYLTWEIPDGSADNYATDFFSKDHLNKIRLSVTETKTDGTGALYVDAMSIGYEDDSVTYIDDFETFKWNGGEDDIHYGLSSEYYGVDYEHVKDGLASGKFTIPASTGIDDGEYTYTDGSSHWGISIPTAEEGKVLTKIGMWVYGTGKPGTYFRPTFRTSETDYYQPAPIDLSFEGWKYVEMGVSPETQVVYSFSGQNDTDEAIVFYIDKLTATYGDTSKSANIQDAVWESTDPAYVVDDTQSNKLLLRDGSAQVYGYKAAFEDFKGTIKSAVLNAIEKTDNEKAQSGTKAYEIGGDGISVESSIAFYIVSQDELSTASTVTIE